MLRLLSIRDFVVVSALELELEPGFTVLTGETGAGKSILLDALGLLLGDRFEPRQIRAGAERAELAAAFELDDVPAARVAGRRGARRERRRGAAAARARRAGPQPRVDQRLAGDARAAEGAGRDAGRDHRPARAPAAIDGRDAALARRRVRRVRRARAGDRIGVA